MAQRSHVPKFGNWESEENVPYTAYFDKARKGRTGGKMINPNDPEEVFSENASPPQAPPSMARAETEEPTGQVAVGPTDGRRMSKEDGDLRHLTGSPARHDNMGRRPSSDSTHQRYGGRGGNTGETYNKRPVRQSTGSDHSIERSPLHYQARIAGRAIGGAPSPSWEGKNSSDSSHGTPGRSRMKPNSRSEENPDKGAAVPKFGEWDENNPASADGYTHIFNKVREEKRTGEANVGSTATEPSYGRKKTNDQAKICCFPWGRK